MFSTSTTIVRWEVGPTAGSSAMSLMGSGPLSLGRVVVLVENKAGLLARVANLFARRGYNIVSLAVAPTHDETFSRITIVVDVASSPLEQIVKQLFKLINVVEIAVLNPGESVERELLLATVSAPKAIRGQITELVDIFEGKIVAVFERRPHRGPRRQPGQDRRFRDAAGRLRDHRAPAFRPHRPTQDRP